MEGLVHLCWMCFHLYVRPSLSLRFSSLPVPRFFLLSAPKLYTLLVDQTLLLPQILYFATQDWCAATELRSERKHLSQLLI